MRLFFLLSFVLIQVSFTYQGLAQPYGTPGQQVSVKIQDNPSGYGFYEYLPRDFSMTSGKKFPVLFFYHGIGEKGDGNGDLSRVLKNGPPMLVASKGWHFPAIVISPQSRTGWFGAVDFKRLLNFLLENDYPVDTDRIYVTGLSAGGGGTWKSLEGAYEKIAAIVPICGANKIVDPADYLQGANIWAFHNFPDPQVPRSFTEDNVNRVANNGTSVMDIYPYGSGGRVPADSDYTMSFIDGHWEKVEGVARPTDKMGYTLYHEGGHNAWTRTYENQDMWEWLFSRSLKDDGKKLSVEAGLDKTIESSQASLTVHGKANLPVTRYEWSKVDGPGTITISGDNSPDLVLSGYVPGVYTFELKVTNDRGESATDSMKVYVRTPLTVDAGPDKNIRSDVTSLVLNATPNRTVRQYKWVKLGGPTVDMENANTSSLTLKNFKPGTYIIRITVFDQEDFRAVDDVKIVVTEPVPLTVDAGSNQVIISTKPQLKFTATPSRAVVSYHWEKRSGPAVNMENTNGAQLTLSNYAVGSYKFKVTVKASDGSEAVDEVGLTVKAPLPALSVDAGADKNIRDNHASLTLNAVVNRQVSRYRWVKVSGPTVSMQDANVANLVLSSFKVGVYVFEVTVTDSRGDIAKDQVKITVRETPLSVNIGPDKTINEGAWPVTISATANQAVVSYEWTQLRGPWFSATGQHAKDLTINSMRIGTYEIRVKVTDAKNRTAVDDMVITVNPSIIPPLVYVGADLTIPNDKPSLKITAKGNRSVVSYQWRKMSGPTVTMGSTDQKELNLRDFRVGVYNIKVTVANSIGTTSSDEIKITVIPANHPEPTAVVEVSREYGQENTYILDGSKSEAGEGHISSYEWTVSKVNTARVKSLTNITEAKQVLINFSDKNNPVGAPWNSTDGTVTPGVKVEDAIDIHGHSTGIQVKLVNKWDGSKVGGMVTGDDSGVVPDNVMNTLYWFKEGEDRNVIITGLVPNEPYDFAFMGSRVGYGEDKSTIYSSQGKSDTLNALNNVTGTASLKDLIADGNGEIELVVRSSPGAEFAYLNAMIITTKGYQLIGPNSATAKLSNLEPGTYQVVLRVVDDEGNVGTATVTIQVPASPSSLASKQLGVVRAAAEEVEETVTAYPNPTRGVVNLRASLPVQNGYKVNITDMNGAEIEELEFSDFATVDLTGKKPGVYIVRLHGNGGLKILKLFLK